MTRPNNGKQVYECPDCACDGRPRCKKCGRGKEGLANGICPSCNPHHDVKKDRDPVRAICKEILELQESTVIACKEISDVR